METQQLHGLTCQTCGRSFGVDLKEPVDECPHCGAEIECGGCSEPLTSTDAVLCAQRAKRLQAVGVRIIDMENPVCAECFVEVLDIALEPVAPPAGA